MTGQTALVHLLNLLHLDQPLQSNQLLLVNLQSFRYLFAQLDRLLPHLLLLSMVLVNIDSDLKYPLALRKLHRGLITDKVLLSVAVGIPTKLELVRCKLSKEIGTYLCHLVKTVDLNDNFYGLVGVDFCGGGMDLIMGRVVGLDLKLDDMGIAVVAQLDIAVDQRIGDATPIVEGDCVLPALPHELQVFFMREDAIAVDAALEDGGFLGTCTEFAAGLENTHLLLAFSTSYKLIGST